MGLIAGTLYDPGTAASISAHALSAMTAFDTTNLRLTFSPPASGNVQVRIGCTMHGSSTMSQVLLGILKGATVVARQGAICGQMTNVATSKYALEATFTVTGLSGSQTWDAAYAIQVVDGSTAANFRHGGPNDTTTDNAWGGFTFEVWDAPNLLGSVMYDPSSAVSKATSALLAMTALDTTNLRVTFTAPTSGIVLVKHKCICTGSATAPGPVLGVLSGASIVARAMPMVCKNYPTTPLASTFYVLESTVAVFGLTPGNSYSFDAAYGVETATASTNIKYGGPNDATGADAWGAACLEVWKA